MEAFSFVVMSDSHIRLEKGYRHTVYPSGQLANGRSRYVVDKINQLIPDFVVHLGDVVHPIPALAVHEAAVQIARDLYRRLKSRLYVVPGNHDVGDKPNAWVPAPAVDQENHEVFEKHWGRSYLSFDRRDCHFVLFNSPVLNSGLQREKDQRAWLEQDLAAHYKAGKRLFLFTHYPIYLGHPQEEEHYDNIAEPARSWLLSLLETYNVEALFAGHSHHFFYDRYRNTDLYVVPSVTFVRPDLSELFHIAPTLDSEYGRNDVEKLGFFVVTVDRDGHRVEPVRTHGLTDEQEESVATLPLSLSGDLPGVRAACVGVFLRHAWAQSVTLPYGNLDEFARKTVRNDYPLRALWELGIRKLRVPITDLANDDTRERMRVLHMMGQEFTVFSVGAPTRHVRETIAQHQDLIAAWEVTAPWDQVPKAIRGIREVKRRVTVRTYLSRLDTLDDQRRDKVFRFSHLADHGFRLEEEDLLSTCLDRHGAAGAIDGFVFRLTPATSPWQGIQAARQIAAGLNVDAAVHVQLPREDQGLIYAEDREISNRVAETLVTSFTSPGVTVFLDTFVDHDRGYYPRHGLLDRRYNPRSSYYVLCHLHRALGGGQQGLEVTPVDTSPGIHAFALETPQYACVLLLSDREASRAEMDLSSLSGTDALDRVGQWMDLRTGKVRDVHWRQSPAQGGWIVLDSPSVRFDPALLILRASRLDLALSVQAWHT
jgi:3',5'-cyclic AMP phosphodiesterase CpdA